MMALKRWTEKEDNYLRKSYSTLKNELLAVEMNRTKGAIKDRALRLGIAKVGSKKRWSQKDHSYLAANVGKMPTAALAKELGRSKASIHNRCNLIFSKESQFDLVYDDLFEAHFNPFLTGKIGGKAKHD